MLERHDEGHTRDERLRSDSSDSTTRVAAKDGHRQLYEMLEAALARVSVLEGRRDICYQNAFKAAGETECMVRGCGAKSSSCKNDVRHLKNTRTPEHEISAILLQQRECLQCGTDWKSSGGLDHHERTVHQEIRSSRMDTFRPYLEKPSCKYLSVMTGKLWLINGSLYTQMSINLIVTARTGNSAVQCVGSESNQLVQLQRPPAVGRPNTCGCCTGPSAAWSRKSTAPWMGSFAAELVELQRFPALGKRSICISFDAATAARIQRSDDWCSNAVRLSSVRLPAAVGSRCSRRPFNAVNII